MIKLPITKENWGPGPWQDEPDRIEWTHSGFPCLMNRTDMGNWCGYVAVAPGHPFYGKTYSDCTRKQKCREWVKNHWCEHSPDAILMVHGGLTYSDSCQGHICHVPKPGEPDNVWWFGFDCAHANDLVPSFKPLLEEMGHPHPAFMFDRQFYRDVPYVKKVVNHLAEQLHQIDLNKN